MRRSSVAGRFRVDPAGLTGAAGRLSGSADALYGVDLSGPLASVSGALPSSSTAGGAADAGAALTEVVLGLSVAVSTLGSTAAASAGNRTRADSGIASSFSSAVPPLFVAVGPSW